MLRDILEVGHRIESTLRVAETEEFIRDSDFAVFQQLDGGQVCVDIAPCRGFCVQKGLRTVCADTEAIVVGHHDGKVPPGERALDLRFHRGTLGIGGDGPVVGQADARQIFGTRQCGIGDKEKGRKLYRIALRIYGTVGKADGTGGGIAVGEEKRECSLGRRQVPPRLIQIHLQRGIILLCDDLVIASGRQSGLTVGKSQIAVGGVRAEHRQRVGGTVEGGIVGCDVACTVSQCHTDEGTRGKGACHGDDFAAGQIHVVGSVVLAGVVSCHDGAAHV